MEQPPFRAYRGDEPYVFVSYSHVDVARVYPELAWLRETGFNVWYDEGISPGALWRDDLARAIEGAALLLLFVSPSSARSSNCLREVSFALDRDLPVVSIFLEPTDVPATLRFAILDRQNIHRYLLERTDFERRVREALRRLLDRAMASEPSRLMHGAPKNRVCLGVRSRDGSIDGEAREVVNGVSRYITWHGGAFRATGPLQADYLIEIGVQSIEGTMRVSWEVRRTEASELVWSQRIDEASTSFALKADRIAETIAEGALQVVGDHERARIASAEIDSLAYGQLLLRADQLNYLDARRMAQREAELVRAIALEPDAGLAHAFLADLLSWRIMNGVSEDAQLETVRLYSEAQTALQLDPSGAQVLLSVGLTYCRMGEYTKGLRLIRRSLTVAPTAKAKDELARSLCFAGQPDEAIELFEEILDSMPTGRTFPYGRLAVALTQAGRLTDAAHFAELAVTYFPNDYYGWLVYANVLALLDRMDEALRTLSEARRLVPRLKLETVIERTQASYGRDAEQRSRLTDGFRKLLVRLHDAS